MMFEYITFTRRPAAAASKGKCPQCYGEGILRYMLSQPCPLCKGSGLVDNEIIARHEAEYRAWLKRRKVKKPRRK